MYTSDPSGQFYSLQYEASKYLGGWMGLMSDRISCRNHYMCSGEATSRDKVGNPLWMEGWCKILKTL